MRTNWRTSDNSDVVLTLEGRGYRGSVDVGGDPPVSARRAVGIGFGVDSHPSDDVSPSAASARVVAGLKHPDSQSQVALAKAAAATISSSIQLTSNAGLHMTNRVGCLSVTPRAQLASRRPPSPPSTPLSDGFVLGGPPVHRSAVCSADLRRRGLGLKNGRKESRPSKND